MTRSAPPKAATLVSRFADSEYLCSFVNSISFARETSIYFFNFNSLKGFLSFSSVDKPYPPYGISILSALTKFFSFLPKKYQATQYKTFLKPSS